jgi:hypothetical protein
MVIGVRNIGLDGDGLGWRERVFWGEREGKARLLGQGKIP